MYGSPKSVKAWERALLDDLDVAIRTNPDALQNINNALDEGLDAIDAVDDAAEALNTNNWQSIKTLFKRGNDFNRKGRIHYGDNRVEIVLKGVNGKTGKRLDTYIPPSNGSPGRIISRKGTTLSEIQPNTFKNYLNELITKYPKGAELNSSKFPPGTILDGDYKLEIPESNRLFFESSEVFQNVLSNFNTTKGVNIEIIYLVE